MTTSTVTPEIADFAWGVRAALADLPADEVDDLTEGLEADLAEAYAEDLHRELPDPAAYASELRTAAGLPERADSARRLLLSGLSDGWSDTRRDIAITLRRHPPVAGALDFLSTLRPLWWVVRAWLATWLISAFFGMERGYGFDGAWWLVLLGFVVVSVQWGRGRWRFRGLSGLIVLGNVIAVIALLPALAAADDWHHHGDVVYAEEHPAEQQDGIWMRDAEVTNIFAYDADGTMIRGVQLFDQAGRPLAPMHGDDYIMCDNDVCEGEHRVGGVKLETGVEAFNVFPLDFVPVADEDGDGFYERVEGTEPAPPKAPFLKVPAVLDTPQKVVKSND